MRLRSKGVARSFVKDRQYSPRVPQYPLWSDFFALLHSKNANRVTYNLDRDCAKSKAGSMQKDEPTRIGDAASIVLNLTLNPYFAIFCMQSLRLRIFTDLEIATR